MTIAVCTVCGAQKFGAFLPCNECGTTPKTVEDRAKSIFLSDHNFPYVELQKFSRMLKNRGPVLYDPVGLASIAYNIASYDYYWQNISSEDNILPCMRCNTRFQTDDEEVLCPTCRIAIDKPMAFCRECLAFHAKGARFCSQCGVAMSTRGDVTTRSVAFSLMLAVERLSDPAHFLKNSEILARTYIALPKSVLVNYTEEIRWLAIYIASTILRRNHSSRSIGTDVIQQMIDLYCKSLAFRDVEPAVAVRWQHDCVVRLDEYDLVVADFVGNPEHDPNKWFLAAARAAKEHCCPTTEGDTVVWELVLLIGCFSKGEHETLKSTLG